MRPSLRRALAALAATTLVFAACGDDDSETTAASTTTSSDTPTSIEAGAAGPARVTSTTGDVAPVGTIIEIEVAGGEVTGGGRQKVTLGESVTIRVTSDVDDHIHLHGYDVLTDVRAGTPAELTFDATIPGVFEVELEDSGVLLVELEIS